MALLTQTTLVASAHKAGLVIADYRLDPVGVSPVLHARCRWCGFGFRRHRGSARGVCYGTNRNFHTLKASVGQLTP
jgi:hypothetical protein